MYSNLTVCRVVHHLRSYGGNNSQSPTVNQIQTAIEAAYLLLTQANEWRYLYKYHRMFINGTYNEGTIAYVHDDLEATITGGTWPSWADQGELRIGNLNSRVESAAGAVLTLDAVINPGADVAAGSSYILFRDRYTLPTDFVRIDDPIPETFAMLGGYVEPRDWAFPRRQAFTTGQPARWTITSDPYITGRMALLIDPPASEAQSIDFHYWRRPAALSFVDCPTAETSSDAIDIDQCMNVAFLRGCEYQLGVIRRRDNLRELHGLYITELRAAMAADSKSMGARGTGSYYRREANAPYDPTASM